MDDNIRVVVDDAPATAAFARITASATAADSSVNRLGSSTSRTSAAIQSTASATTGATAATNANTNAVNRSNSAFQQLTNSATSTSTAVNRLWNLTAASAFASVMKSTWRAMEDAASSYISRLTEVQQTISLLNAVDSSAVGDNYDYLIKLADQYGIRLSALQDNYAKLTMAAEGTSLTTDKIRKVFEATSTAARVLHLKTSEVDLAFLAIVQMASKGTVSMEELRRQFAERIPGAIPALSRELGVATGELLKFIESGEAAADKMLPFLATALERTYGPGLAKASSALDAEINRIDNSLRVFFKNVYDADGATGPTSAIRALNEKLQQPEVAENLARWVNQISESMEDFIRSITAEEIESGANTLLEILQAIGNAAIMAGKGIKWMTENMGIVAPVLGALIGGYSGMAFGPAGVAIGAATGAIVGGAGYLALKNSDGPSAGSKTVQGQREAIANLEAQNIKLEKEINTFSGNFILAMFDDKDAKKAQLAQNKAQLDSMKNALGSKLLNDVTVTDYASDLPDLPTLGSGNLAELIGGAKGGKGSKGRKSVDPITREYNSLAKTLSKDVADAYAEAAAQGQNLNEAEEKFISLKNQPIWSKLAPDRQKNITALYDTWAAQIKVNEEEKRYQDYMAQDVLGKKYDEQLKSVEKSREIIEQQQLENQSIGKTKEQIDELKFAKQEEAAVDLERRAAMYDNIDLSGQIGDQYRAEADNIRKLNELKRENAELTKLQAEAEKSQKLYESLWSTLESSAADAFMHIGDEGVNAFKRIGEAIKTSIIKLLYEITLKRWIINLSGLGGSSLDSGINLSTLTSLYSAYSTAAAGGSLAAGGSMAALGAYSGGTMSGANALGSMYANASGTGINGLLATNSAYGTSSVASSTMASGGYTGFGYLGYAALIAAAVLVAENLYEKGYNRAALGVGQKDPQSFGIDGQTSTGRNEGSTAFYNYSPEAANRRIGSAIGLNEKWTDILSGTTRMAALFGRKLSEFGFEASVSNGQSSVREYEKYKGGLFRSNKTVYSEASSADSDAVQREIKGWIDGAKNLARAMGYGEDAINKYTGSVRINFKGANTAEEITKRYAEAQEKLTMGMLSAASGTKVTKEKFQAMMEQINASIEKAGITSEGIGDIIAQGAIGKLTEAQVGEQLSEVIIGGIYKTIAQQAFQPVIDMMMSSIITPIFTAIMAGVPIAEVISQGAIDNMVESANRAADALEIIYSNAAFMEGIERIRSGIQRLAGASARASGSVIGLSSAASNAANKANEIAQERYGLETQLLTLLGESAKLRERELNTINPANRALQQRIWAIEDAKTALDGALEALSRSIEAQKETLSTQLDLATESQSALTDVFELLNDSIRELRQEVEDAAQMEFTSAMKFIRDATSSGKAPDGDALRTAISSATDFVQNADYATQVERDRAYLDLANSLDALNKTVKPQLDAADLMVESLNEQIKALDEQLKVSTNQYNALLGIDESVISVEQAILGLANAMANYSAQIAAGFAIKTSSSAPAQVSSGGGGYSGGGGGGGGGGSSGKWTADGYWAKNPDLQAEFNNANLANAPEFNKDPNMSARDEYLLWHYNTIGKNEHRKFGIGSAFHNGVVKDPTMFDIGEMGELNPEAIMPLQNIGGSLGVRAVTGSDSETKALLKAILAKVSITATATQSTALSSRRLTNKFMKVVREDVVMVGSPE